VTRWVRYPTRACRSRLVGAGGSLILETQGRAGAAPTKPGRVGTTRRCGPGKRRRTGGRKEPVMEPPIDWIPARIWWIWAGQQQSASRDSRRQAALSSIQEVDGGGRGDICDCPTARCRGRAGHQSRRRGSVVNVGTAPVSPFPPAIQVGGGQARRLLMTPGRGGVPVVVRGRESRPHGEGGQQSRSVGTGRPGGRW